MGKKNTIKQLFSSIPEKTKQQAKLAWQNEMLNNEIIKKFNISYTHLYKLIDDWKDDYNGGSTIMSHPDYLSNNIPQNNLTKKYEGSEYDLSFPCNNFNLNELKDKINNKIIKINNI